MGGAILQTRRFRSGPIDIEILRSAILLSAHQTRHHVGAADPLPVGVPVDLGVANAEGAAVNFARRDHVHNHPAGLGVNLHHTPLWTFEAVSHPSAAVSVSYTGLSTHDLWLVVLGLVGSQAADLRLRLNNNVTYNYFYKIKEAAAVSTVMFANHLVIAFIDVVGAVIGTLIIAGHRKGTANRIMVKPSVTPSTVNKDECNSGYLAAAAGDLSRIDIFPSVGNFTGDVSLYHYDFPT